jgi:hypothetical protein
MENKKWGSTQTFIVIAAILIIFSYIVVDVFLTKPKIVNELTEVKTQYKELSTFLDKKIPEIDSTFKEHAFQIKQQKDQMDVLEETFKDLK